MKALIKTSIVVGLWFTIFGAAPAFADGFKNCTKIAKASWKPASDAEAAAKAAGYQVQKSKVEAPATKFMASRTASCSSCSTARKTSA
jgi:hypothetical protein